MQMTYMKRRQRDHHVLASAKPLDGLEFNGSILLREILVPCGGLQGPHQGLGHARRPRRMADSTLDYPYVIESVDLHHQ